MIKKFIQPKKIEIDDMLRLVQLGEEKWECALKWYQNPRVIYFSEGLEDTVYDRDMIKKMYDYLSQSGELYFIEILTSSGWQIIGDATLLEDNIPIVIGEESYWGQGIGKKVIGALILRAKALGMDKILVPEIYNYNERSKNLFLSLGFIKCSETKESSAYVLDLKK